MNFEQQIAEHLTILLKRKGLSQKDLIDKGLNADNVRRVLQIGDFKGKSYNVSTLRKFLNAMGKGYKIRIEDTTIRL